MQAINELFDKAPKYWRWFVYIEAIFLGVSIGMCDFSLIATYGFIIFHLLYTEWQRQRIESLEITVHIAHDYLMDLGRRGIIEFPKKEANDGSDSSSEDTDSTS